ncbi:uncharacterized protein BJ171DRAFT_164969 [Polychytrium aggregatum]|uniref:uncharacterized protein n=1 Tax=Polychytrium aggregatum TaxID=110093 RepID=UPI0022FEBEEE|nr:uncharacterized protein BJ171DRAFT_164969 [Polychytrium aggregatum]KAI9202638.1 hypothetical protein BJ171DRAFT_164969 [Polychytrium aggregatum]
MYASFTSEQTSDGTPLSDSSYPAFNPLATDQPFADMSSSSHPSEPLDSSYLAQGTAAESQSFYGATVGHGDIQPPVAKTTFCCNLDRVLSSLPRSTFRPLVVNVPLDKQAQPAITIVDAVKTSEVGGGSYIAYVIRTDIPSQNIRYESRHRYSEFEALRSLLSRIHYMAVIPPIPEKHSIGDYATKQAKAKEDKAIIEKRKRMLQSFLNRVATHPLLVREHVFHQFLEDPEATWSTILSASEHANLGRRKDKSPISMLTDKRNLDIPDPHFVASEEYTLKFSAHIAQTHKHQKKITKLQQDVAQQLAELGAVYNGWSLTEHTLAAALESVGAATDTTAAATGQLAKSLEEAVTEPIQEYVQFSGAIEKLLRWRHTQHCEYESTIESLTSKEGQLTRLEASEHEAQRLTAVLNAEGSWGPARPPSPVPNSAGASTEPKGGILKTLNSLIDNDPEATRRNNISKLKDRITHLKEQEKVTLQELNIGNEQVQKDLDRFQRCKIEDVRSILLSYAIAQRDYHRRAAAAWSDAKIDIEQIHSGSS